MGPDRDPSFRGGPLIDALNAVQPGAHWGYPALFLMASASTLLGTLLLLRVRRLLGA